MQSDLDLTKKQHQVFDLLVMLNQQSKSAPTLEEICTELGLKSRGSLHKHIQGLVDAGLVVSPQRRQRGVRLTAKAMTHVNQQQEVVQTMENQRDQTPYVGVIAAGSPIEAVQNMNYLHIPEQIKTENECYVLKVKGDSMIDAGIYDQDWVIIEQRCVAKNGDIVVALVDKSEATLKYIEQYPHETILIPANKNMEKMRYRPEQVEIQGVLVGQMRSYK